MKHPSLLNAITQPIPHRTSVHSHMQSTAYHYNSILNAKSEVNSHKPNQKIFLQYLENKRNKNLNKQRIYQNKKILKSLIEIQRNYSLYATKNQTQISTHQNKKILNKTKRKSLDSRLDPLEQVKTLKNPFVQKMEKLKISSENLKLFEKISTTQSSFANKKQMKQWNSKIKYLGSFLQSDRCKQSTESLKNQFFSTFIKMRQTNNLQSNTIRLEPKSLITNPELKTLSHSKRMFNEPNQISLKESFRIKKDKKKNRKSRRTETQGESENHKMNFYTESSQING